MTKNDRILFLHRINLFQYDFTPHIHAVYNITTRSRASFVDFAYCRLSILTKILNFHLKIRIKVWKNPNNFLVHGSGGMKVKSSAEKCITCTSRLYRVFFCTDCYRLTSYACLNDQREQSCDIRTLISNLDWAFSTFVETGF